MVRTDRIHHSTHSIDQSRTEGARDPLARGRQGAYMWSSDRLGEYGAGGSAVPRRADAQKFVFFVYGHGHLRTTFSCLTCSRRPSMTYSAKTAVPRRLGGTYGLFPPAVELQTTTDRIRGAGHRTLRGSLGCCTLTRSISHARSATCSACEAAVSLSRCPPRGSPLSPPGASELGTRGWPRTHSSIASVMTITLPGGAALH